MTYLETFIKGGYVEDPALAEQCGQRFMDLRALGLDEGESLEFHR